MRGCITSVLLGCFLLPLTVISPRSAQAQTLTVLYNFTGGQDGASPYAGVTMDKAGNLYGTASEGGSSNRGTVFKLSHKGSNWLFSPLYSFTGRDDGGAPIAPVVFGPDGSLYGTTEFGGRNCGAGCGTVFNLKPPAAACRTALCAWTETVLYHFTGSSNGANPGYGSLIFDQAGHIYGTTFFGGNNDEGIVYELTPANGSWSESAIYVFSGTADGGNPYSSVIFDQVGNLYGTALAGGAHGNGTVFQLTPSGSGWAEKTLLAFQSASSGGSPYGGLVFDTSGNLYGGTSSGGTESGGTVYELTPSNGDWTLALLYAFSGTAYQPGPYDTLTLDAAGTIYGTTQKDGAYGMGSVFKLTSSGGGWVYSSLHDFTGGSDGANPIGGVILDANGNLYGTTKGGGTNGDGVVFEITP